MNLSIEDGLWWSGHLRLPSWAGYQSRFGPYGSVDAITPSDGRVKLVFAPEGRRLDPLSSKELELIAWFEANEPDVSEVVRAAIVDWCSPDNIARARDFDFDEAFPVINHAEDLKRLCGLHTVYIHQLEGGGVPYVGYELGCEWEDEHGLGVLQHGTRTVSVGFADTAFLLWMAEKDWETRTRKPEVR